MANVANQVIDTLDFELASEVVSKDRVVNFIAKITQFLTWPFLFIIFKLFFRIKLSGRETFSNINRPFIIIANHTSFYDSFLFRIVLGFKTPHLPLRFMAVKSFESDTMNMIASIGFVDFVYSLFGVFTVTPGLGLNKNLKKSKDIIYSGGNIVIYPEGRINREDTIGPFKNGAAVLYKETGAEVVPVSIKKLKKPIFYPTIEINVGNKMEVSRSRSVEEITKQFRNTIIALSQKSNRL